MIASSNCIRPRFLLPLVQTAVARSMMLRAWQEAAAKVTEKRDDCDARQTVLTNEMNWTTMGEARYK
jgi:hypothetical protein